MTDEEELRKAVALNYDGQNAPNISAKGEGSIAEQIVTLARQHGVPLFENPELLKLLSTLELGDEIPETLYLCIAQVIAFAYKIQEKVPEGWQPTDEDNGADNTEQNFNTYDHKADHKPDYNPHKNNDKQDDKQDQNPEI